MNQPTKSDTMTIQQLITQLQESGLPPDTEIHLRSHGIEATNDINLEIDTFKFEGSKQLLVIIQPRLSKFTKGLPTI